MQKRFVVYLMLLLCLLPFASQTFAAAPWSARLYNAATGTITWVDYTGAILDQFVLPSEFGYSYSRSAAVSDDGSLIAYVVSDGAAPFNGYLYIYDRAFDTVRFAFDMGATPTHSLDFTASNLNFSADGGTFAFGYANSDMSRWWAIVIDLTTFTTAGIRSTDPLPNAMGLPAEFALPVVQYNRDGQVIFTPVLLGTEGLPEYDAFAWDVAATTLEPDPIYRTLGSSTFLPTGEVIMALEDARLPLSTEPYAYFHPNSLQVFDPSLGLRYPFYTDSTQFFYSAKFVQGGERVLAGSIDLDNNFLWSLMERSGSFVGILPRESLNSVEGVLDGFIYVPTELSADLRPQLFYVETRDGLDPMEIGNVVWSGDPNANAPLIVWHSDLFTMSATAFTAWAQLAEPYNPLDGIPAAGSSAPEVPVGDLRVGGEAVINTTAGDVLNVRTGAGTNFEVVARLNTGEVVTLLEGPVPSSGFTWWRVRTASGIEGWVVESVDDNGTRLQTLVPR